MDALKIISEGSIKAEKPQFNVGDTVRVDVRIKEGDRERIQAFEGTVIAKKHGGVAETFTVRRVAYGVGIERVFPINSPFVEKVTVVRKGKVRRAKLSTCVAVRARLPRSRAIFDDSPFQSGRKGDNSFVPFFLLYGAFGAETEKIKTGRSPDKEVHRIWNSHSLLSVGRACWNGTKRLFRRRWCWCWCFPFLPYHSGGRRVDGAYAGKRR